MTILLHLCCGPCGLYPLRVLREEGHAVTAYFYNPNIHPLPEYLRRRAAAMQAACHAGVKLIMDEEDSAVSFFRATHGREQPGREGRCGVCQSMRLARAARVAWEQGFQGFTTSLLYSRHQDHDWIRQEGERLADEQPGPIFLYRDFRAGWQEGIDTSKALGMYRQPYCGCLYSIEDRYARDFARARQDFAGV